jgi:hypothetical protein
LVAGVALEPPVLTAQLMVVLEVAASVKKKGSRYRKAFNTLSL